MQMLRIFLGHLPGHRGCSFQVFWTLHHADAPGFLRTFTWTLWVVFLGFLYILQMLWKFCIFLGHLPRQGLLFLGFPHTTLCRCSGLSWDIYLDTRAVFLGFSTQYWDMYFIFTCMWHICLGQLPMKLFVYIMQMLWIFSGHLPRHHFFWAFCTSPGHVLNGVWVNVGGNMLSSFWIFTHQYIMQMLWKFRIVPGHLYGHHVGDLFLSSQLAEIGTALNWHSNQS